MRGAVQARHFNKYMRCAIKNKTIEEKAITRYGADDFFFLVLNIIYFIFQLNFLMRNFIYI